MKRSQQPAGWNSDAPPSCRSPAPFPHHRTCPRKNCAETLESIQETFYQLRSDMPNDVPDEELIEGMFAAFEGSCGGDCDALAALSASEVLGQLAVYDDRESPDDEPYSLTDGEGRVYSWNPDSWEDNIYAPGWLGERWENDRD
ncbi:MAG: DUF6323 family protein [Coriobacteriaceae bacterium]|nr:DUF6323 family protein [Coriobacteriaceae bacterium]